jgi:hypothetical protein
VKTARGGCSGWNYRHWRYAYFNNDREGFAVADGRFLRRALRA